MKSRCKLFYPILLVVGGWLLLFSLETLAQPSVAEKSSELHLEEVVVSARRVTESLQDVPLSISVLSGEDMRSGGIISIDDIAVNTPGLVVSNYTGTRDDANLRFRGMDNSSRFREDALASAFIDGVYLSGSSQWVSTNDLQRVEVVKGPQSAFFGRGTFGGAVNFVTKDPSETFQGDMSLTIGENGRQDFDGSLSGPLLGELLSYRVSGRFFEYDGAFKNGGTGGGRLGAQSTESFSLTLLSRPTDNLKIRFRTVYSEDDDGPGATFLTRSSQNNCGPLFDPIANPPPPGVRPRTYYCGDLNNIAPKNLGYDVTADLGAPDTSWPRDLGLNRYVSLSSLLVDWNFNDFTFSSLTGAYKETLSVLRDHNGVEPGSLLSYWANRDTSFSQEFRLASPADGKLRWMVGTYYLDLKYSNNKNGFGCANVNYVLCNKTLGPIYFGASKRGAFDGVVGPDSPANYIPNKTVDNIAVFGTIAYDVTDRFTVNLEARYAKEKLDFGSVTQETPDNSIGDTIKLAESFNSFTPRLILEYQLSDSSKTYFSYAEGNLPGGFNEEIAKMSSVSASNFTALYGVGAVIDESQLDNFEIGYKATFLSGRAQVNAAVYYMDWTDQRFRTQVAGFDTNGDGVFNSSDEQQVDYDGSGSSEIHGFEISGGYLISESWVVDFSYNYNKTKLIEYMDLNYAEVFGTFDASGNELPRSPQHSFVGGLGYTSQLIFGGEAYAGLDAIYNSKSYAWVNNLAHTGSSTRFDLNLGWRNDEYDVSMWVRNLTDEDTLNSARRFSDIVGGGIGFAATLVTPREIGVTLRMNF